MQFAEALFWIWAFCAIFIFPFYTYKRINDLAQEIKILRGLLFSDQTKAVHKETAKDTPLAQAAYVADVAKPIVESIPREKAKDKSSRAIFDLELQVGT